MGLTMFLGAIIKDHSCEVRIDIGYTKIIDANLQDLDNVN